MGRLRFLAYGGTQYSERNRIGAWPKLDLQLQSKSALHTAGRLSFGCGIFEDRAFLIARQLQDFRDRSGVPYTALLAPSDAHWKKFGWNAALLLRSIREDREANVALFESPERLDEARLHAMLDALKPSVPHSFAAESPSAVRDCWMASAFAASSLNISTQSLGFGETLEVDNLASALAALPPTFRIGQGWLIGGDRSLADAFCSRLLVDASASRSATEADTKALLLDGRKLFDTWTALAHDTHPDSTLGRLSVMPLWQWTENPEVVARNLRRIEQLRSSTLALGDAVDELDQLDRAEPLFAEVLKAGRHLFLESKPLPPLVVDWYLRFHLDHDEELTDDEYRGLREATQDRCRSGLIDDELALHYGVFGGDPGGKWLVDNDLEATGQEVFDRLLDTRAKVTGARLERVEKWLAAADTTVLYKALTLPSKLAAGRAGITGFKTLAAITGALQGERPASPIKFVKGEKAHLKPDLAKLYKLALDNHWTPLIDELEEVVYSAKELRDLLPKRSASDSRESLGVLASIAGGEDEWYVRRLILTHKKESLEAMLRDEIDAVVKDQNLAMRLAQSLPVSIVPLEMLFPFLSETQQDRFIRALTRPRERYSGVLAVAVDAYSEARRGTPTVGPIRSILAWFGRSAPPPVPPRLRAALLRCLVVESGLRQDVGQRVHGEKRAGDIDSELTRLVPPSSVTP